MRTLDDIIAGSIDRVRLDAMEKGIGEDATARAVALMRRRGRTVREQAETRMIAEAQALSESHYPGPAFR